MRDYHHAWFERRWYVSKLDKEFRQYPGFVILTDRSIHNDLHAIVKPPIKPAPPIMQATLEMLQFYPQIPEDNLPRTGEFMYKLSAQTDDELLAHRLQRIGANLLAQHTLLFGELREGNV